MTVGQRVRLWRKRRQLTQRELADLAGCSLSMIEKIEAGDRALDNKALRAGVANALQVPIPVLLGQPYEPLTHAHALADVHVLSLRRALTELSIGVRGNTGTLRPIEVLQPAAEAVARMRHVPDWAGQMAALPDLISDLAAHTSRQSRHLLMDTLYSASQALKFLGHLDLAMYASERAAIIAADLDEPAWLGFADFARANALPAECPDIAAELASRALAQIRLSNRDHDLLNVYGQLHLCAGLQFATAKNSDTSQEHMNQAETLAVHEYQDGGFRHLQFGPANAARYRMKASLELGNPGRALVIAKQAVRQRTPFLQASYHIAAGRALHHIGRDLEAVAEFDRAERVAPQLVHVSPSARTTVETILTKRARRVDESAMVTSLAERMGIYLPHKL